MESKQDAEQNTLRVTRRELDALLDELDQVSNASESPKPIRRFVRWAYRRERVPVTVTQSDGPPTCLTLVSRNLSPGGISLFHAQYVHTGSRVVVTLRHPTMGEIEFGGEVVRCEHRGGRNHEIGIKFDREIPAREILSLDPMNERYLIERVEPSQLKGTLVVLDENELDRTLVAKLLDGTNLVLKLASSAAEAIELVSRGVDIVLCDYHLTKNGTASEFISDLRKLHLSTPTVVMTADKTLEARTQMIAAGASALISKPLSRDRLLRAVAEFLIMRSPELPIYSTLEPHNASYPLVRKFVEQMPELITSMDNAIEGSDVSECEELSRRVMALAGPLGFAGIGGIAELAYKELSTSGGIRGLKIVRELVNALERVQQRGAA